MLFEGGEAQRFDEDVVAAGVRGVRRVLAHLGMTANRKPSPRPCVVAWSSRWIRAPRSGRIADVSVPELMHGLAVSRASGVLVIEQATLRRELVYLDAVITRATSFAHD